MYMEDFLVLRQAEQLLMTTDGVVLLSSSVYKLAPEGVFADGHRQSNVVSPHCPSKFPLDGCQCPRTNKEARGSAPRLRL